MKKISTSNILLKYILKVVFSSIFSILILTYILSQLSYHFDLDSKYNTIFTVIICAVCAAITAFISTLGIRNNGLMLGAFAQIPLTFYSLLNVIFNENTWQLFLLKAVLIVLIGMLVGYLTTQKSKALKIK